MVGTGGVAPSGFGGATNTGGTQSAQATGGVPGSAAIGGTRATSATSTASSGASPGSGGVATNSTAQSGGAATQGGSKANGGATSGGTLSTTGGTKTSVSSTGGSSGRAGASGGTATGGSTSGAAGNGGTKSAGGNAATGGVVATGGISGTQPAVTVYLAGDSIVSTYSDTAATNDQAGWGQMLPPLFNSKVTFVNRAAGGRTAYWFYLEGVLDKILTSIKAGDYLLIEFGTNDQNTTATFDVNGTTYPRLAEPALFKTQLKQYYLDPVKAKGAIPVLVTPPPRNSAYCNGGNGLGAYATAMIELGAAENVLVIDNNAKTYAFVKAICPKPTTATEETFFFGKSDGTIDGTHFQENGARKMAGFIADGIRTSGASLAEYLL